MKTFKTDENPKNEISTVGFNVVISGHVIHHNLFYKLENITFLNLMKNINQAIQTTYIFWKV